MRSTRRFLSGFRLIVDTLVDTPLKRVAICSEKNPNMALMLGRNGKLSVKSYDSVNLGDSSELLNSLESAPESSFLPKSFLSYLQPSDVSKFCEHLNPIIFFNLGINKSTRHIDFYNFCIPDDFLDEESKRRVMRNRSKILGVFPLLGKITVGDFKVGFRLLKMFDLRHNDEAINAIKDYFRIPHTSTTGFMKRIAYAPMYPDGVRNLDEMLRWGLVDSAKDKKEYEKRIFNIPLPHEKEEEEEYEAMWTIIGSPNFSKFDSKTRSNIFLNIKKGEWATNLAAINNEYFMDLVSQYSQAIADDLLLPIYAQELYKQCREIASGTKPEDLLKLMSHEFTRYVRANLKVFAEGILFSDLTPKQMLEHAKGFDRKIAQLNEAKPVLVARNIKPKDNTSKYCPQWHKIFPDQEIDGFKFKVLTSDAELLEKSNELSNCLTNFSKRCKAGKCHIVYGTSPTGKAFAIRFNDLDMYEVNEYNNRGASPEVRDGTARLCEKIKNREIAISSKVGSVDDNLTLTEFLGFDLLDRNHEESVRKTYHEAKLMPDIDGFRAGLEQMVREDILEIDKPSSKISTYATKKVSHFSNRDLICLD